MDAKEEGILGEDIASHWYYISKGRALRYLLRGIKADEVLDVGAGSGVFSRQLLDKGICKSATCIDPAYEKEYIETHNGHKISFVRSLDGPSQELVLMMDVLEHVDDDVGLLRKYVATLPPKGYVVISVPAFQFLWSGHDVFLEHRRRYTRKMLDKVVTNSGLRIVRSRYFFGLLFPFLAAIRLYESRRLAGEKTEPKSALKKHSHMLNAMLTSVHNVERKFLFRHNVIAGLSVFCLAQRK